MKKVLLPILLAATVFASCQSEDARLKTFENKEFGAFVIKQEKLFTDMMAAMDAKDSAKLKTIEAELKTADKEGEKFMASASEADVKAAGAIFEPVMTKYLEKVMGGNLDLTAPTVTDTSATSAPATETPAADAKTAETPAATAPAK